MFANKSSHAESSADQIANVCRKPGNRVKGPIRQSSVVIVVMIMVVVMIVVMISMMVVVMIIFVVVLVVVPIPPA